MLTTIDIQVPQHLRRFDNQQFQSKYSPFVFPTTPRNFAGVGYLSDPSRQQISGSLQLRQITVSHAVLPCSDPYRVTVEPQASILVSIFDFGIHTGPIAENLRGFEMLPPPAPIAASKVVASFIGRVESLSGDSANVLLINDRTSERLESQCDTEVLRENGIAAGDEFRCEVVRYKGTTSTRLSRLPPKKLSKEQVARIGANFKDRWTF